MPEQSGSSSNAFEGTITDALHFSPMAFLRTFWAVSEACNDDQNALYFAIRDQSWANLIAPVKYYAALNGLFALILIKADKSALIGLPVGGQYAILGVLFGNILSAIPIYLLIGGRRHSSGNIKGPIDGIFKISQVLIYVSANILVFSLPFVIGIVLNGWIDHESRLFGFVSLAYVVSFLLLTRLLLERSATAISKLFGVSYRRAHLAIFLSECLFGILGLSLLALLASF